MYFEHPLVDEVDLEEVFLIDCVYFSQHLDSHLHQLLWSFSINQDHIEKKKQWSVFCRFKVLQTFLDGIDQIENFVGFFEDLIKPIDAFLNATFMNDLS